MLLATAATALERVALGILGKTTAEALARHGAVLPLLAELALLRTLLAAEAGGVV